MEVDEQIGRHIERLRAQAGMTQTAFALAMRDRGWKWSQPTVVAVEKGERALKLSEARDAAEILDVEDVDELLDRSMEQKAFDAMEQALAAEHTIVTAAAEHRLAMSRVHTYAGAFERGAKFADIGQDERSRRDQEMFLDAYRSEGWATRSLSDILEEEEVDDAAASDSAE